MTAAPPVLAGGTQASCAEALPATAFTPVGAPGTVTALIVTAAPADVPPANRAKRTAVHRLKIRTRIS
ncbi:MAG: hypothetical protein M3P83_00585 [Actinomycetota bacterium]|nr:hypothetical protein [Actinomycetota bacterium]